jgi:hypothetical protein
VDNWSPNLNDTGMVKSYSVKDYNIIQFGTDKMKLNIYVTELSWSNFFIEVNDKANFSILGMID